MKKFAITILWMFALVALNVASAAEGPDKPRGLREDLEKVYSDYLTSVEKEDTKLLLSVLPAERIAGLKKTFEMNGMKFPDDYFSTMRKYAPKMPPIKQFRFIATTDSPKYANLIYVGNMNGYLRKTNDEMRFLVVQFEKESNGWKYALVVDPPARAVPDLEQKLSSGKLGFLSQKPFTAEKIELRP